LQFIFTENALTLLLLAGLLERFTETVRILPCSTYLLLIKTYNISQGASIRLVQDDGLERNHLL